MTTEPNTSSFPTLLPCPTTDSNGRPFDPDKVERASLLLVDLHPLLDFESARRAVLTAGNTRPQLQSSEAVERVRKLSRAATPGEWFTDSEDCDTGHGNVMTLSIYSDGLMSYGKPAKLFDALNSDAMLVEHDDDEYGGRLFDRTSYANAEFIVACVNFTRAAITALTSPAVVGVSKHISGDEGL